MLRSALAEMLARVSPGMLFVLSDGVKSDPLSASSANRCSSDFGAMVKVAQTR